MQVWTNGKRHCALTHSEGILVWDDDDGPPRSVAGPASSDPLLARSSAFAVARFGSVAWARHGRADIRRIDLTTGATSARLAIGLARFVAILSPRQLLVGHQVDDRIVLSRVLVDLEGRVLERTELPLPDDATPIDPTYAEWAAPRMFDPAPFDRADQSFVVRTTSAGITVTNVHAGVVAVLPPDGSTIRALLRIPRDHNPPGHAVAIATPGGILCGTSISSRAGYMARVAMDGFVLADSTTVCFGGAALLSTGRALYIGTPTARSGKDRPASVAVHELDLTRFTSVRVARPSDHAMASGFSLEASAEGECAIVGTRDAVIVIRRDPDGTWSSRTLALHADGRAA
jgi:hypothetical protein